MKKTLLTLLAVVFLALPMLALQPATAYAQEDTCDEWELIEWLTIHNNIQRAIFSLRDEALSGSLSPITASIYIGGLTTALAEAAPSPPCAREALLLTVVMDYTLSNYILCSSVGDEVCMAASVDTIARLRPQYEEQLTRLLGQVQGLYDPITGVIPFDEAPDIGVA
jgi:hypothetical protein